LGVLIVLLQQETPRLRVGHLLRWTSTGPDRRRWLVLYETGPPLEAQFRLTKVVPFPTMSDDAVSVPIQP
jgi:hypothetical protein